MCACARARACAYVLLSSFVCLCVCVYVCTCARMRACARVSVFMSGRARVGESAVVVCGGVVWFAYRRASLMAGRGPRWRLTSDLCLPLLPVPPPQGKERR